MSRPSFKDLVQASGGVQLYLDRTKSEHNGVGYRLWKVMRTVKVSHNSMHKLMNLSRRHIEDLIELEQEK
jgi:hypothetical protein